MSETLEHLKEYLQVLIDSGQHKIFYNDLMHDEKTIDCINAINDSLKEIERLTKQNKALNEVYELTKKEYIRLNNIIKEVREYIEKNTKEGILKEKKYFYSPEQANNILEILDKGSDKQ